MDRKDHASGTSIEEALANAVTDESAHTAKRTRVPDPPLADEESPDGVVKQPIADDGNGAVTRPISPARLSDQVAAGHIAPSAALAQVTRRGKR